MLHHRRLLFSSSGTRRFCHHRRTPDDTSCDDVFGPASTLDVDVDAASSGRKCTVIFRCHYTVIFLRPCSFVCFRLQTSHKDIVKAVTMIWDKQIQIHSLASKKAKTRLLLQFEYTIIHVSVKSKRNSNITVVSSQRPSPRDGNKWVHVSSRCYRHRSLPLLLRS